MKKNSFYLQFALISTVLILLYILWPLPFKYFSQKVLIPAIGGGSNIISKVISPFRTLAKIQGLDDKNKNLEEENLQLRAQLIRANELEKKCVSQINEKESSLQTNLKTTQALVIGKSPFSFNQVFIINKGFDDGIREKAVVLSQGYLLGQVAELSHKNATVKLITSHDSLVPAITSDSRQSGIIQGGLAGLSMTDVPVDTEVGQTESVITSGMGGEIPFGIPIGQISAIKEKSDGLFKDIKINYPINPNNIEVVTVTVDDESF